MAGFDKVVKTYDEALAGLRDGMTVIAGGFGLCGIPEGLIAQIRRMGVRDLTVVAYGNRGKPEEARAERITANGKTVELR